MKIALEADGWWHRSPEGATADRQRDSWLQSQGWVVFRVDDEHGEDSLRDQVVRVALLVRSQAPAGAPWCHSLRSDADTDIHWPLSLTRSLRAAPPTRLPVRKLAALEGLIISCMSTTEGSSKWTIQNSRPPADECGWTTRSRWQRR